MIKKPKVGQKVYIFTSSRGKYNFVEYGEIIGVSIDFQYVRVKTSEKQEYWVYSSELYRNKIPMRKAVCQYYNKLINNFQCSLTSRLKTVKTLNKE